ncbi:hypothetical protein COCSUDRAFT_33862 [Coccomyxa subellipsoidea C-169]|uniref:Uncharacterized protein n=1 Tax=Coccomyxa subellipsoidea (strain C-169) TaxID=574566 RepID=I0YQN6_COCSC|nr:hypothetical protein COCSUDRAFT_33862 [Coccomyxa subellipsoidea C-169]EIE20705.1 hypothetical protein COCSUDRAFT_33862 [Coccomyxa subellipsoidea C-169]|eukprot:XP_005645249.1 hypothetical protein COCSUDRAFT_33862 [Coccomyxa subellipsoidea C-169]
MGCQVLQCLNVVAAACTRMCKLRDLIRERAIQQPKFDLLVPNGGILSLLNFTRFVGDCSGSGDLKHSIYMLGKGQALAMPYICDMYGPRGEVPNFACCYVGQSLTCEAESRLLSMTRSSGSMTEALCM